jgi:hypothetical protein
MEISSFLQKHLLAHEKQRAIFRFHLPHAKAGSESPTQKPLNGISSHISWLSTINTNQSKKPLKSRSGGFLGHLCRLRHVAKRY